MWCAIILAGGSGQRMGAGCNKVLLPLAGEPVICRSVRAFLSLVDVVVVVTRSDDQQAIMDALHSSGIDPSALRFAEGGEDRQASVWNGLQAMPEGCHQVLVHDGARCLVDKATILRVMASVDACGTGVAAIPVTDTIKVADHDEFVSSTPVRASLRAVQTPQGFLTDLLVKAHQQAFQDGYRGTDDASLLEHMGHPVRLVEGNRRNIKLTTPEDMKMAESFFPASLPDFRVGHGFDVHRLVEGRDLILCGVQVPHTLGLLGHSDADVALHALMDAMLGTLSLGDIGQHFPDSDPQYKGISSMELLHHVTALLDSHGAHVTNADITIAAQKPKLASFIPLMKKNVAEVLHLPEDRVSVKATTTEHLGFEGREEGISATAVCMVLVMPDGKA